MKFFKFAFVLIVIMLVFLAAMPAMNAAAAGAVPETFGTLTPEQSAFLQILATRSGWLGLVIGLDLVLGVTVALKQKVFRWDKLADFLANYGPKMLAWLSLEALGLLPPEFKSIAGIGEGLGLAAYGLIMLSAAASVLGHVQAIGVLPPIVPGVPPTNRAK